MEFIPEDKYFKYNPDTLIYMRKLYNLDKPGQMDEAIDLLDAWLQKQNHFVKKDFSRDYLERVIILLKGSVERAKGQIEKICSLRTLLPQYFEKLDAKKDYNLVKNYHTSAFLPNLTEDHFRIYLIRLEPEKFTSKIYLYIYFYNTIICEYLKAHDYSNGLVSVVDFRNVNSIMDFVTQINLTELRQLMTIFLQGYGCRVKKIIMISESSAIELMVKIFKQILSEKMSQRIEVVPNLESLYEFVPRAALPCDYGGEEKSLAELRDDFVDVLASKENVNYLKEMSKARTIESFRTATSKINEDFLGIAGSFRTLSVD